MASGRIEGQTSGQFLGCWVDWSSTENVEGNYSDITFHLRGRRLNYWTEEYGYGTVNLYVNGEKFSKYDNHYFDINPNKITTMARLS